MATLFVALPELDFLRPNRIDGPLRRDELRILFEPPHLFGQRLVQLTLRSQHVALPTKQAARARTERASLGEGLLRRERIA